MKEILDLLENATSINPIPLYIKTVQNSIVYKYYQVSTFRYKLEVRVIGLSYADAERIAAAAVKALNDRGDNNQIPTISSIVLNGGGELVDYQTNTYQRLLYFDVVTKEGVN